MQPTSAGGTLNPPQPMPARPPRPPCVVRTVLPRVSFRTPGVPRGWSAMVTTPSLSRSVSKSSEYRPSSLVPINPSGPGIFTGFAPAGRSRSARMSTGTRAVVPRTSADVRVRVMSSVAGFAALVLCIVCFVTTS